MSADEYPCIFPRLIEAIVYLSLHNLLTIVQWEFRRQRNVHTTPEKFESAALFLLLSLPSTLIRHENGAFRKRSSTRRNLKTHVFRFRTYGNHFKNRAFRKREHYDNLVIFLTEFSSNTKPKWPVIVTFLNSPGVVWTENIWCVFRVKPPFSNCSGVVCTASNKLRFKRVS